MKKRLSIWLCLVLVLSLVFSPDMAEAKKKSKIKLNERSNPPAMLGRIV